MDKKFIPFLAFIILLAPFVNADVLLTSCGETIGTYNERYYMTSDIVADTPLTWCMGIGNDAITIDCQGHRINGSDLVENAFQLFDPTISPRVLNCNVTNFNTGLSYERAENITVINNTFSDILYDAMAFGLQYDKALIENNTIGTSNGGINFNSVVGSNWTIRNNRIDATSYTILFNGLAPENYLFYNNYFPNGNVSIIYGAGDNGGTFWNTTRSTNRNILGYNAFGGNYWGSCTDIDFNGYCDSPQNIEVLSIDNSPLSGSFITPHASTTANIMFTNADAFTMNADILGHQNTVNISQGKGYFKFDISNISSHLFSHAYLILSPTYANCAVANNCYHEIKISNDVSWNEDTLNNESVLSGTYTIISAIGLGNSAGNKTSLDFFDTTTGWTAGATKGAINISTSINNLYESSQFTLLTNVTTHSPGGLLANVNGSVWSREGSNVDLARINFTLVEYLNGTKTNTDLTTYTMLDLETGINLTGQTINSMDLFYLPAINSIYPNAGMGVTFAYIAISTNILNDLATRILECPKVSSYNTNPITPNIYPGQYFYICVNLSARHGGRGFYGLIKVINNTNVRGNSTQEFDYYFAVSSPNYFIFNTPTYSPSPPANGLNLTVTTTSGITLIDVIMYFRFNATGNFTPLSVVPSEYNTYSDFHKFYINNQYMTSADYEIYFIGSDGALNYTSAIFRFNVSMPFTNIVNGSALPNAITGLVNAGVVPDQNSALWLFGSLIIVMGSGLAFWFGGLKFGLIAMVALIVSLALMGFLPQYILIPILIIATAIIVKWARGIFGSNEY